MNFTELEPNARAMEINEEKGYERLHIAAPGAEVACANDCGKTTSWANLAFEAPVCSHECVDALWRDYFLKLRASLAEEQRLEAAGMSPEDAINKVAGVDEAEILGFVLDSEGETTIH